MTRERTLLLTSFPSMLIEKYLQTTFFLWFFRFDSYGDIYGCFIVYMVYAHWTNFDLCTENLFLLVNVRQTLRNFSLYLLHEWHDGCLHFALLGSSTVPVTVWTRKEKVGLDGILVGLDGILVSLDGILVGLDGILELKWRKQMPRLIWNRERTECHY